MRSDIIKRSLRVEFEGHQGQETVHLQPLQMTEPVSHMEQSCIPIVKGFSRAMNAREIVSHGKWFGKTNVLAAG